MAQKKVMGIWMDSQKAFLIATSDRTLSTDFGLIKKVESEHHHGKDYKNVKVELSKEKLEQKKFFKEIANEISDESEIFIFGPGKAQEEFQNFLKDYHHFNTKKLDLGSSDHLQINQIIERVRNHFEAN